MRRAALGALVALAALLCMGAKACGGAPRDGGENATVRCHSLHPFSDCGPGGTYGWRKIGESEGIPVWVPHD